MCQKFETTLDDLDIFRPRYVQNKIHISCYIYILFQILDQTVYLLIMLFLNVVWGWGGGGGGGSKFSCFIVLPWFCDFGASFPGVFWYDQYKK